LPSLTLNNGQRIPIFGLGTWKSQSGQVEAAVKHAIDCGYTHIDCAPIYGNETEVGDAIKEKLSEGVITRSQLFVTSKLWNSYHHKDHVKAGLIKTLQDLQLDYLDLFLMHWPHGFQAGGALVPKDDLGNVVYDDTHFTETWLEMEKLVAEGLVKSIGISNFNKTQVEDLLAVATIKPVMNQVECHPFFNQIELATLCEANGIKLTAYSPLGQGGDVLKNEQVLAVAAKHGKSPAQIFIRYQVERGIVVVPKSVTPARIMENFSVFDFQLDEEDMSALLALPQAARINVPCVEVDGVMVPRDAKHPLYPFQGE